MNVNSEKVQEIITSQKFQKLVRMRQTVTLWLTAIMLIVYFGFILCIAFYKELLAYKIGEHLTLGLPIGIGIIIFAWILTGIYTRWANRSYDQSVRELRDQILNQ